MRFGAGDAAASEGGAAVGAGVGGAGPGAARVAFADMRGAKTVAADEVLRTRSGVVGEDGSTYAPGGANVLTYEGSILRVSVVRGQTVRCRPAAAAWH